MGEYGPIITKLGEGIRDACSQSNGFDFGIVVDSFRM